MDSEVCALSNLSSLHLSFDLGKDSEVSFHCSSLPLALSYIR